MPIYDLVCPKCDNEWEGFSSVDNKDKLLCSSCGAYGVTQITCKSAPEIYGHYDPGLNSYVKSKKHRKFKTCKFMFFFLLKRSGFHDTVILEYEEVTNSHAQPKKKVLGNGWLCFAVNFRL